MVEVEGRKYHSSSYSIKLDIFLSVCTRVWGQFRQKNIAFGHEVCFHFPMLVQIPSVHYLVACPKILALSNSISVLSMIQYTEQKYYWNQLYYTRKHFEDYRCNLYFIKKCTSFKETRKWR